MLQRISQVARGEPAGDEATPFAALFAAAVAGEAGTGIAGQSAPVTVDGASEGLGRREDPQQPDAAAVQPVVPLVAAPAPRFLQALTGERRGQRPRLGHSRRRRLFPVCESQLRLGMRLPHSRARLPALSRSVAVRRRSARRWSRLSVRPRHRHLSKPVRSSNTDNARNALHGLPLKPEPENSRTVGFGVRARAACEFQTAGGKGRSVARRGCGGGALWRLRSSVPIRSGE
jgi:hypothetical protein